MCIEHEMTKEITCPYCGDEYSDSWEYQSGEEDCGKDYCGNCGKYFEITRNYGEITYSTTKSIK